MTIKKILTTSYQSYPHLGVGDIDFVLAATLHRSSEYLYSHPEKKLNRSNLLAFKKLLKRRLSGWSIASLKGYKEFFGLKFLVNKATLIPRPDSELLVQTALDYLNKQKINCPKILDVGTGSGCLILSLVKNLYQNQPDGLVADNPTGCFTATDISGQALAVARTNARKLGLKNKTKFLKSNLLKNIPPDKYNVVLANLPYLTKTQLKEPSIKKEPVSALYGGKDGLDYYRKLLKTLPKYLAKKYLVLLEIDPSQTSVLDQIIKDGLPDSKIEILKDLSGQNRLAKITN